MISDFETRLAEALGTRIAAPFTGRVDVAPGEDPGNGVRLAVGVVEAQMMEPEIGSRRSEVVPGDAAPRRALRLRCTVALQARMKGTVDRALQMRAIDAAIYALDDAEFRSGRALADGTDRGFVIHELQPSSLAVPLDPDVPGTAVALRLTATGLFWPIGVQGQTGRIIDEIRFRGGVLPLDVLPAEPLLVAGGPAVPLTIRFGVASMRIRKEGVTKLPFGSIAVTLVAAGGKPGKGTLTGGDDGTTPQVRILTVANAEASVSYTPPAEPASEELVVAFEDGEQGLGIELGRVPLTTLGA